MLRERERTRLRGASGACGTFANWGSPVTGGQWSWSSGQVRRDVSVTPKAGRYVCLQRLTSWGWYAPYAYAGLSYVPVNLKYAGSGTATYSWVPTSETRYLYDGMLVIQERDTNNIPTVSYTRGVDLSGSRQGAGGIGGLLARSEHATYSPYNLTRHDSYHADGNGNITAMVYGGSELSASYQYDPYGRMMATGGTRPTANLYRFSSKMVLTNSGLYYYGYRFYDPNLQRWPNRDPIGERGGVNLYTAFENSPVGVLDPDGWFTWIPFILKKLPKPQISPPNYYFAGPWGLVGVVLEYSFGKCQAKTCEYERAVYRYDEVGDVEKKSIEVGCCDACPALNVDSKPDGAYPGGWPDRTPGDPRRDPRTPLDPKKRKSPK